MLEILSSLGTSLKRYTAAAPLAVISNQYFGRAFSSQSFYDRKIILTGGFAQPASPYPTNFRVITMATNGLSVESTVSVTGYDGSSPGSTLFNSTLWVAVGHDGAYQRYLRGRNAATGALITTTSNSPGTPQAYVKVAPYDNDQLFWGFGLSASGWLNQAYTYRISNNTWSALPVPNLPDETIYGQFTAQNTNDGRILVGLTFNSRQLVFFKPSDNTYSLSKSFSYLIDPGVVPEVNRGLGVSGTAVVGKYLLFFVQGLQSDNQNILSCVRYDTQLDDFSVIDLPGRSARWGSRVVIDDVNDILYIIGGASQPSSVTNLASSTKFAEAIAYPVSQFLI